MRGGWEVGGRDSVVSGVGGGGEGGCWGGELGCGGVAVWESRGLGELRCAGVAVCGSCGVGELRGGGVAGWGGRKRVA